MTKGTKTKQSVAAVNTLNAYRRLFATDDGKVVLYDLMQSGYINRSLIGTTPYETYFNEGVRSVVLRLMSTANMDEKQVERVLFEMNKSTDEDVVF